MTDVGIKSQRTANGYNHAFNDALAAAATLVRVEATADEIAVRPPREARRTRRIIVAVGNY
jgi:hypothetical protein